MPTLFSRAHTFLTKTISRDLQLDFLSTFLCRYSFDFMLYTSTVLFCYLRPLLGLLRHLYIALITLICTVVLMLGCK